MNLIALKMLFGDRVKYMTMLAGVTFASVIMTQQPSILSGLLSRTYSFVKDTSEPNIWVMDPGVNFVEENKHIRLINLNKIKGIEGVEWAVPMYKSMTTAKLPDGRTVSVDLTGLDDSTLIGAPSTTSVPLLNLRRRDAVLVEASAAKKRLKVSDGKGNFRPLKIGDVLEINDRRAFVIGTFIGTPNFILQPQIYTLYSRSQEYAPPKRKGLTYLLIKAKAQNVDNVIKKINDKTGLKALNAEDFKYLNLKYWKDNTGIPINFGISVVLGFLVGAAVVAQTFFNFVHENAKYFAALQAMGLSNKVLIKMVIIQALTVGITGFGLGIGGTVIFGLIMLNNTVLAFKFTPFILLGSLVGVIMIISIAAILGIRKIIKIDPSVVFRS
jgi:putative ABC transport system permease protein